MGASRPPGGGTGLSVPIFGSTHTGRNQRISTPIPGAEDRNPLRGLLGGMPRHVHHRERSYPGIHVAYLFLAGEPVNIKVLVQADDLPDAGFFGGNYQGGVGKIHGEIGVFFR